MKLNHDCVRDLLLTIEEEVPFGRMLNIEHLHQQQRMQNYLVEDVIYTAFHLEKEGFIDAVVTEKLSGPPSIIVKMLTYSGHEFLDNIRDGVVWKETKSTASKLAGVSLNILAELASSYIKSKLRLS